MAKSQVEGSKRPKKKPPSQRGNGGQIIGFTHQCRWWLCRDSRTKRNSASTVRHSKVQVRTLSAYSHSMASVLAVPSLQLHPVFGAVSSRVPPGDAMSRFVGFGDKSWDNFKNFFQTQGFEFMFLSQRPRLAAFGGSIAPKTPVLKLSRPLACKPPAAIASELTRVVCAPFAKPQVAGLRHS